MNDTASVRRAGHADIGPCADVLAAAFGHDPVSCWLFPDADDRARRQPRFFEVILAHVLADGEVHRTADGDGVALWLPMHPDMLASPLSADEAVRQALGPNFTRLSLLDRHMRHAHPRLPHAYLPFIGVLPERQGHGLGRALLDHKLSDLDTTGMPAYLEASSPRSQPLYRRAGFTPMPEHIDVPKGPRMQPMWRIPKTPGRASDTATDLN